MKQDKIKRIITKNGGKVYFDPDKRTDFVMVKADSPVIDSKKCLKADELEIPIISEDYIHDSINKNKVLDYQDYEIETDSESDEDIDIRND